jgi:hypothetical protein
MDCSYSIHPAEHLVRVHVTGGVTVQGMVDLIRQVSADALFRPGMNSLVDMREASGSWDFSETQRYRDFLRHMAGEHSRRWAIVVRPGMLVGLVHLLIVISEPIADRIRMELFDDPAIAMQWAMAPQDESVLPD